MKEKLKILLFIVFAGLTLFAEAQTFVTSPSGNKVEVKGTSSLHDWKMDLDKVNSGFQLVKEGSSVKSINNVTFSCKAKDLKSESSLMDKKAWDALKANDQPELKFTSGSITDLVTTGDKFSGKAKGQLTVAGETREVTVPFTGSTTGNSVRIDATTDLAMSNFKITPPTAMLGSLKTGDKITVSISLQYIQK